MQLRPETPEEIAARVRDSFLRQPFMTTIGAELVLVEKGRVVIRCPVTPPLLQQHGLVHGGVIGALADTAAGYSTYSVLAPDDTMVTVEYKINLLRPARGEAVEAEGRVTRTGRSLTVGTAKVFMLDGGRRELCAHLLGTWINLRGRSDRSLEPRE